MQNDSNSEATTNNTPQEAAWQSLTGDPSDATRQKHTVDAGPFADRVGATAGIPSPSGSLDIMPDDFPLIVWLRGDEPWFNDFSVDADTAMAELGIRRSRLTQISGRELRVGKKRVDRYIRPYFRPVDIAAYKNFTRATASHLKSSAVLDDVLGKLSNETDQILERITGAVKDNSSTFATALEQIASDLRQTQGRLLRDVSDKLESIERETYGTVQASLQRSLAAVSKLTAEMTTLRESVTNQNEKIMTLLNQNHLLLREMNAAQVARLEAMGHQLVSQLAPTIADQLTTASQQITHQIEQMVHQTRLTIRGDIKKLRESVDEQSNQQNIKPNPAQARWRRPIGCRSGYHSRRLRY